MSKILNIHARDSIVYQLTEVMDELNGKLNLLQTSLEYLERARSSAYTEPMDDVAAILGIVSKRLDFNTAPDRVTITNLAGVSNQIHSGEINEDGKWDTYPPAVKVVPQVAQDETASGERKAKKQLRIFRV